MWQFILFALLATAPCLRAAERRWEVQYFYDVDDSSLTITDMAFPSAQRGIAVGTLTEKMRSKPVALITGTGGAKWVLVPLKEPPVAVFFLNDSLGWMVTTKGIWRTKESGFSWEKISSLRDMLAVHFRDPQHGWAVGLRKQVLESSDGGIKWDPVKAANSLPGAEEYTAFGVVAFATPDIGMAIGWSEPPRRGENPLPDWLDPEHALRRPERPTLTLSLETRNGGKSWEPTSSSLFGQVSQVQLSKSGDGLILMQYLDGFNWPSEVYRLDMRTGQTQSVLHQKDRVITDVLLTSPNQAFAAGYEPPGKLARSPVPGKVHILESTDLKTWTEMSVDYRATAQEVLLAGPDSEHVWAATDSGMILRLTSH